MAQFAAYISRGLCNPRLIFPRINRPNVYSESIIIIIIIIICEQHQLAILSGHTGGEIIERDGKKFKIFYGMSSSTAMKKHAGGVAEYRWSSHWNNSPLYMITLPFPS